MRSNFIYGVEACMTDACTDPLEDPELHPPHVDARCAGVDVSLGCPVVVIVVLHE